MESAHIAYCDFLVRGIGLDAKDFTGKSDPYIVIKCPTKVLARRSIFLTASTEIFEYDLNMSVQEEGFSIYPPSSSSGTVLKNSQGTVVFEDHEKTGGSRHHALKAHPQTEGYKEIYESEVVKATLDPQWNPFRLGFYEMCRGNAMVELIVECYDWDRFKTSDFIGSFKVTVKDLLEPKTDIYQLVNKKNEKSGRLFMKCKPADCDLTYCDFKAGAQDLAEKKIHGTLSDPFFVIKVPTSIEEDSYGFDILLYDFGEAFNICKIGKIKSGLNPIPEEYRTVYESKIVRGSLNPYWGIFQIGYYDLCRANPDVRLLVECYDYNDFIPNRFIGSGEVSVRELLQGHVAITLHSKKNKRITGIVFLSCKLSNVFSTRKHDAYKWRSAHVGLPDIAAGTPSL